MLSSADDLFAWVRESMPVAWKMGDDSTTPSPLAFVTKGELISKVFASAERIESVEMLPHVPPLPGHVYTWTAPEGYEPDGRHLDTLLAFFDNLEDETVDRPLLRAALLTPCWGGDYGTRPAFVIEADKSQSGKTTISRVVSEVWGGLLDLQLDSTRHVSPDEISKRLLTPGVRHLRILRLDNCRTEIGGQVVESLVTTDRFRGRQMYVGEGDRPNTTTLFITANAARLTVDVANRSVILRLVEHGGDPSSVKFCHKIGLTYVSCSPFRVPVARLAAAQAALEEEAAKATKARK